MYLIDTILDVITQNENILGYAILFLSSFTEYIFPPFPGDTVTLFGAFLIAVHHWSFFAVFFSVTAGSIAGASVDYFIGKKVSKQDGIEKMPKLIRKGNAVLTRERYTYIKEKFDKYGAYIIILNRFMPGIRAFFFVVAGMTGMKFLPVQLFNVISVILWNLCIIWVGYLVGNNWDALLAVFSVYSKVVGGVLLIAITALLISFYIKRKNGK